MLLRSRLLWDAEARIAGCIRHPPAPPRPLPPPVFTKNGLQTLLVIAALFAVPMVIEACAGDWLRLWVKPWLQPDAFFSLLAGAAVLALVAALACAVLYGLYRFATGSIFGAIVAAGVVLYGIGIIH